MQGRLRRKGVIVMKRKLSVVFLLTWSVVFVSCGGTSGSADEQLSKDQVRQLGKADWWDDFCELFGWYGDGVCDEFCPLPDPDCAGQQDNRPDKLWGIDANYLGLFESEEIPCVWMQDGREIDPLVEAAEQGAKVFRMRIWIENPENGEPGILEDTLPLALRAQDAGLYVIPTLFLSKGWGADSSQYPPRDWMDTDLQARAERVRRWTEKTVGALLTAGIDTRTYAIGNETDYGFCGEFEYGASPDRLQKYVWPRAAVLLAAAEQGVRNASGRDDLEFILHISRGQEPTFATKFFAFMRGQGVQVDLAGLSYYPSSWGQEGFSKFPETVDSLYERLGLPVFIAEYAYPALDPASVDPQQGKWWNRQIDGYPFSEEGQADFMRDLHAWMIKGDRLA
ncbi:MAG: hypothetical protein DRI34_09990, partial [Deltaproteobacteria bacterium]